MDKNLKKWIGVMIHGNLEYICTSLPYLSFEDSVEARNKVSSIFKKYADASKVEKSPKSILEDEVSKFLNPNASKLFRKINLDTIHSIDFQKSKNKLLASFSKYVYDLKQELRQLRIARRNKEKEVENKKQQLPINPGNPLEEELQILRLQWYKLEELSIGHYANFTALITYKLKLLLLLRWWSFDMDKGFELFVQTTKKD